MKNFIYLCLLVFMLQPGLVVASSTGAKAESNNKHQRNKERWQKKREEQQKLRSAVSTGEVLPLTEILAKVQKDYPGKILAIELETKKEILIYEIKLLGQDNHQLRKLHLDAKTGEYLDIPQRKPRNQHKKKANENPDN